MSEPVTISDAPVGIRHMTSSAIRMFIDDDRGAQAAEYAMVGGIGAATCGGVVVYINNEQNGVVGGVIESLLTTATNWISNLF